MNAPTSEKAHATASARTRAIPASPCSTPRATPWTSRTLTITTPTHAMPEVPDGPAGVGADDRPHHAHQHQAAHEPVRRRRAPPGDRGHDQDIGQDGGHAMVERQVEQATPLHDADGPEDAEQDRDPDDAEPCRNHEHHREHGVRARPRERGARRQAGGPSAPHDPVDRCSHEAEDGAGEEDQGRPVERCNLRHRGSSSYGRRRIATTIRSRRVSDVPRSSSGPKASHGRVSSGPRKNATTHVTHSRAMRPGLERIPR